MYTINFPGIAPSAAHTFSVKTIEFKMAAIWVKRSIQNTNGTLFTLTVNFSHWAWFQTKRKQSLWAQRRIEENTGLLSYGWHWSWGMWWRRMDAGHEDRWHTGAVTPSFTRSAFVSRATLVSKRLLENWRVHGVGGGGVEGGGGGDKNFLASELSWIVWMVLIMRLASGIATEQRTYSDEFFLILFFHRSIHSLSHWPTHSFKHSFIYSFLLSSTYLFITCLFLFAMPLLFLSRQISVTALTFGATMQPNAFSDNSGHSKARIGILGNNENDCDTGDSRIGFGCGGHPSTSNTCGNVAVRTSDIGERDITTMGYILVQWEAAPTCSASL